MKQLIKYVGSYGVAMLMWLCSTAQSNITSVEYYIDTDPGWGNGVPVAIPNNVTNLANISVATNVTGLKAGLHTLYIRGKDNTNAWSLCDTLQFNIPSALAAPSITVNSIVAKTSNCAHDSLDISYHATGIYNAGNKFNAELSDAAGNFGAPTTIGSHTGTGNAIVKIQLPSHLADGNYKIRVVSTNPVVTGMASDAIIIHDRPELGKDTSVTIGCANGTANLTTVYNLTGLTATYNTTTPAMVNAGSYMIVVANSYGCKDTANIAVLDASTKTVPTSGSDMLMATRECTDVQGWTHYYNDNGTPSDYSDDIRLLSLKKNGNNIGTIGDGKFQLKVVATAGAGSNHAVKVTSALVPVGKDFLSMNRYWNVTPATQPASSVGVRFYYNTQDLADVNGDYAGGAATETQLTMYKLQGGNPDPTSNWSGGTGVTYYISGSTPSLTNWVYTDLGNNTQQAEFMVSSFSGGGAGMIAEGALPVTITSFTALAQKDRVALQWQTATEINSKEFSIQRSLDGSDFETIGTLPASGNSNNQRSYRYDDLQGISFTGKIVFFRIMETDIDGHSYYTDVKNVKIPDGSNQLILAYNPVRNEALLKYQCLFNEKIKVMVIDHLGRVVLTTEQAVQSGINEIKLKTGNLAQGIYEVELSNSQNQYYVRMMKE